MDKLLEFFDKLEPYQKKELTAQIKNLDLHTLKEQRKVLATNPTFPPYEPLKEVYYPSQQDHLAGIQLLKEGKVGCLVVAGGQGTRLKIEGPKGLAKVTIIRKKTLFELLSEKVSAASDHFQRKLMIAFMTSPKNHSQTLQYFQEHHYFGLDPSQIDFFCQTELPFLDNQGQLFLEEPYKIAQGPDGNGSSLQSLVKSGIWGKWKNSGVEIVNFIQIDNPLADPFDTQLIGFQHLQNLDVAVKCIQKETPEEKVGILVHSQKTIHVIEYSEITDASSHHWANISLFCFSMNFIDKIKNQQLPLHKAYKAVKKLNTAEFKAWKFEKFIFDVFAYTTKIKALAFPREQVFAPLKNATGDNSLATVQKSLQNFDREMFNKITGRQPPPHPFELSPKSYYSNDRDLKYFE